MLECCAGELWWRDFLKTCFVGLCCRAVLKDCSVEPTWRALPETCAGELCWRERALGTAVCCGGEPRTRCLAAAPRHLDLTCCGGQRCFLSWKAVLPKTRAFLKRATPVRCCAEEGAALARDMPDMLCWRAAAAGPDMLCWEPRAVLESRVCLVLHWRRRTRGAVVVRARLGFRAKRPRPKHCVIERRWKVLCWKAVLCSRDNAPEALCRTAAPEALYRPVEGRDAPSYLAVPNALLCALLGTLAVELPFRGDSLQPRLRSRSHWRLTPAALCAVLESDAAPFDRAAHEDLCADLQNHAQQNAALWYGGDPGWKCCAGEPRLA